MLEMVAVCVGGPFAGKHARITPNGFVRLTRADLPTWKTGFAPPFDQGLTAQHTIYKLHTFHANERNVRMYAPADWTDFQIMEELLRTYPWIVDYAATPKVA